MSAAPSVARQAGRFASPVYLGALVAFGLYFMWSSLFRRWFASSDEYVFAFEVIRFVKISFIVALCATKVQEVNIIAHSPDHSRKIIVGTSAI